MDQSDNNEDEFYDVEEQPPLAQPPLALAPLAQPPLARLKIIKKKQAVKQEPSIPKQFTIKDNEYLDYKMQLFGKKEPERTDKYCEFYLCNDIQQIKYFSLLI